MKKNVCILIILLSAFIFPAVTFANQYGQHSTPVNFISFKMNDKKTRLNMQRNMNNLIDWQYYNDFTSNRNYNNIIKYATAPKTNVAEENIFRRMEILFFGSLTIISFSAWFAFSIFNIIIYGESFGVIRKEQYLPMYLGSSVLSLSVSVSDLINNLRKKKSFRYVEFYQ